MKERFENRTFKGQIRIVLDKKTNRIWTADKFKVCQQIVRVVADYQRQGYRLSLRQLYYQLVAADAIPNHDKVYKRLSGILDDLRYAGEIDWSAIEDRGRVPYLPYYVHGIQDALEDTIRHYRLDRQLGQTVAVEVWTEKDAISGVLKRITSKYHIQLVVNKGYSSSSAMYVAYRRFLDYIREGKRIVVLYFGDHDPSGLDMVRDIKDRITNFLIKGGDLQEILSDWWDENEYNVWDVAGYGEKYENIVQLSNPYAELSSTKEDKLSELFDQGRAQMYLDELDLFTVRHIGLTQEQIRQFNPPPNPAKLTDPRAGWYVEQFGEVSWEVDALNPVVMSRIVSEAIEDTINMELYETQLEVEKEQIEALKLFAKQNTGESGEEE